MSQGPPFCLSLQIKRAFEEEALLTLKVLRLWFADCKESVTSYYSRFCGEPQNSGSGYQGSCSHFLGSVASATMVASVHLRLFLVGGVSFLRDFYFVWKQFVRKWCGQQVIPLENISGIFHKSNNQVLRALTLWITPTITQILSNEHRRPLTKLLSLSVFMKLRRYFGHEQIIFVPPKPIKFIARANLRAIIWD